MTVQELIDKLMELGPEYYALPVVLEGCDCYNPASGAEVVSRESKAPWVLVTCNTNEP